MEWNKNLFVTEFLAFKEWRSQNENIIMGYIVLPMFVSIAFVSVLYYFYVFNLCNSSSCADYIIKFNSYITHTFPGIQSRSLRGEELYGTGRYIEYIAGISLINAFTTIILSILIFSKFNLWTKYQNGFYSVKKVIFFYILFMLFFSLIIDHLYFDIANHPKYAYRLLTSSILYLSLSLLWSMNIISIIDLLVFWFRSKFSTLKEK